MGSKSLKPPAIAFVILLSLCYFLSNAQGTPFIHVADATKGNDTSSCWTGGQDNPCGSISYALEGVHKTSNTTYHPGVFLERVVDGHKFNETSFSTFNGLSNPNISNIKIVGTTNCTMSKSFPCALVRCTGNSTGLTFIHILSVTIQNVYFTEGCGAVHNSTSKNISLQMKSSDFAFAKFRVALYFAFCKNVLFQHVTVENSPGTGVVVYATTGYNVFQDCSFDNNSADPSQSYPYPGGGGFYLEFPYCSPTVEDKCDTNIPLENVSNSYYLFDGCGFQKNNASVNDLTNESFFLPSGDNHVAFGRGGGLSVFFKGRAHNNTIIVNRSSVTQNSALWGGGLFAEFQDNSTNNSFHVYNSTIELNVCLHNVKKAAGTGGGGVRIGFIFFDNALVKNNNIRFENCTFSNNTGYFGGGLSFYTARELDSMYATNSLELLNCNWFGNRARVGAAIDLSVWHPVSSGSIVHVKLNNITVAHHNSSSDLQTSIVGLGAMYTDTVPAQFDGYINFHDNHHSALAALGSQIDVLGSCTADFTNNHGRNGGAVALFGSAFIRVHNGTRMNLTHNRAKEKGGAIFSQSVGEHDLLSSGNCFIRYSDIHATPDKWQAYFKFTNNTANGQINSIYTTTVLPCLWGGTYGPSSVSSDNVFCWSTRWQYSSNCTREIQTDPAEFSRSSYTMEIFPGQRTELPVVTTDDLKNLATRRTVFTAESLNKSIAILDSSSRYISDSEITLYGIPGKSTDIGLYTLDPRVLYVTINVTLKPCPPGFTSNDPTFINMTECTCPTGYSYDGLVRCSTVDLTAHLQGQGQWIGKCGEACEDEDTLVAGYSPYTYNLHDAQLKLPHNESSLSKQLCGPSNRLGTSCGMCIQGHAPSLNSRDFYCTKCSSSDLKYHWIFFLLTEMFPQTVLFAILVLFNVSLTSGPANAFLFFAQVITTSFGLYITRIAPYRTIWKSVQLVYDIGNLDFFDALIPSYCLSPDMGTAVVITLKYVVAVYPLFLIGLFFLVSQLYYRGERYQCVYYICQPIILGYAKLQRKYGLRPVGSIDALAAFLLLSYTKFTRVSIQLLSPALLYDVDGTHKATVMFLDGTIGFFGAKHIPYILSAIIVIVFFVIPPPLLLLVYPIRKFRVCMRNCTCGGKEEDGRCVMVLQHFLDSFYGCYKDGRLDNNNKTRDMRSFAGVYFLCRIAFAVLDSSNLKWAIQYSLQQILCTGIVLLIFLVKPYKKELYNYVDGTIFSILAAINAFSSYNYFRDAYKQRGPSPTVFALEYILIWLPLAYMVGYLAWYYHKNWKKKNDSTSRMSQLATEIEDEHISDNSIMSLVDERAQRQGEAGNSFLGKLSKSRRHSGMPPSSSSSQYGSLGSTKVSDAASVANGATP